MTNASGIVDKVCHLSRRLMEVRRDMAAMRDELDALGVDVVLDKLAWVDTEGKPARDVTREDFKEALSSVDAFDAFMLEHEAKFYRIASS